MPPALRANVLKHTIRKATFPSQSQFYIRCTSRIQLPQPSPIQVRTFTYTPLLWKKQGKEKEKKSKSATSDSDAVGSEDPFDFSTLSAGIDKSLEKLTTDLGKLRTGGRFNPEILEAVRVQLLKDEKGTERLGDLAQVLPKGGRSVMVLVGEKDHVKPIVSAIQGARDLNLQPQVDAHNALQLNISIPPPTKESRDQALVAASKAGETANLAIKNARAAMQKRLRGMELKKLVRPDDLKKAHKEMEKLVEKAHADVKKTTDSARKNMEQA